MKEEREVENNEEAKGGFLGCLQGTVAIFFISLWFVCISNDLTNK